MKKKKQKRQENEFAIFFSFIMGISAKCIAIYYSECPEPNATISFISESFLAILTNNVSNSMIMIMMYDFM